MKVVWTDVAEEHLEALYFYIESENAAAARRLVVKVVDITNLVLARHPESGRLGRVEGTRELVISGTPYIVSYWIVRNQVEVLGVWHTSRSWPKKF